MLSVPGIGPTLPGERVAPSAIVTSPPMVPMPPSVELASAVVAPVAAVWSPSTMSVPAPTVVSPA